MDTGRFGEGKGRGQVMESYFNFKTEENMRPYLKKKKLTARSCKNHNLTRNQIKAGRRAWES